MNATRSISIQNLKKAFSLAEKNLRGNENRAISASITNEDFNVRYEDSVNGVFVSALSNIFTDCRVDSELNNIDISIDQDGQLVAAIESKGMVSNAHSRDRLKDSLDVHGIRTKLNSDSRSKNSVENDIAEIQNKLPSASEPHFEIFIPIIYELYRGSAEEEWTSERKPWTTLPSYKELSVTLKDDLTKWFQDISEHRFTLIHSTDPIELKDANELWMKQSQKFTRFNSLEAFVSFFVFGRYVGDSD